ncbi:hypothetical protein Q7P35_000061 [Cladosporium inversicolor]
MRMSTSHAHEATIDIHTAHSPVTLSPPLLLEIALSARLLPHPTPHFCHPYMPYHLTTPAHNPTSLQETHPLLRSTPHPAPSHTHARHWYDVRSHLKPASESSVSPRRTLAHHHNLLTKPPSSPACTQLPLQARKLTRLLFKHRLSLRARLRTPAHPRHRTYMPAPNPPHGFHTSKPARFSTYSGAPSLQPSLAPTDTTSQSRFTPQPSHHNMYAQQSSGSSSTLASNSDPKTADIKSWSAGFERMQDARLDKQRYVMSGNKSEEVSKLALGAKLERALGRRMTGQDATFSQRKKTISNGEKALEVEVN